MYVQALECLPKSSKNIFVSLKNNNSIHKILKNQILSF